MERTLEIGWQGERVVSLPLELKRAGALALIAGLGFYGAPLVAQEIESSSTAAATADITGEPVAERRAAPDATSPTATSTVDPARDDVSVGGGWLRRSDLPFAVTFFGSLALVEPLQAWESGVGSVADGNERGFDHTFYRAGAWAGNLWIDLGAAAATFGLGRLAGSGTVARLGLRSLETLVAVDLLATVFKVGVGRQRPEEAMESNVFRPIAWNHEYASFPSGHTAHAFALAGTVSRELGGWAPWVAYPLAAGVGASRIIGNRHWPTDIVAGAALGLFTSRLTGRLHAPSTEGAGPERVLIVLPGPGPGLLLGASFPTN